MKKLLRTFTNQFSINGHLRSFIFNTKRKNLIVYFVLVFVFFIEVLTYVLATFSWYPINCYWQSECTRILLVADPQLIGLHNENNDFLTPISIWDSDRYLSKTYSYAFQFAQPDVVIFLGDLFDEGSIATDQEFKRYLRRLYDIFLKKPFHAVHHIWLPGDNDIGGEFNDRITPHKVKRFEHAFLQPDTTSIKKVKFFKINRLTSTIPKISQRQEFSNVDNIIVGLSHIPLLISPAAFVDKVLDKMHPHLLFTAHTHKSMMVSTQDEFRKDRLITPIRPDDNQVYEYSLGAIDIYEILVPTCSYRMGTDKIGYGLAVIEGASVRYTVLWSPSRFLQLFIYGIIVLFGLTYLVCSRCCSRCNKKNNTEKYTRLGLIA